MTPETCITLSNTYVPNCVPETLKRRWLAELEGHILVCIKGYDPEALSFRGEDEEITLSVPFPFDRLYWLYIVAMTDFVNGDVSRYTETASLFEDALEDYAKWYKRERRA